MIAECGKALIERLQEELIPHYVLGKELIALRVPQLQSQDYVIGTFLYHIEEDRNVNFQQFVDISDTKRQYPGKAIALYYVLFVNEEATFGGFHKEQEDRLLEKMIQIFHDHQTLMIEQQECNVNFDHLDLDSRIRLWQSFSKPLQPAIYVKVHPIMIASLKEEDVHRVKSRHIQVERSKE